MADDVSMFSEKAEKQKLQYVLWAGTVNRKEMWKWCFS